MNIYSDGRVQHEVEVRQRKDNDGQLYFVVTIDGFPYKVKGKRLSDGRVEINHNGKTFKCHVTEDRDERHVFFEGRAFKLKKIETGSLVDDNDGLVAEKVAAPMPSVIVKYLVSVGDQIKVNQKLLVLEAMKMQNTLVAPYNGTIKKIFFNEGDQVDEGVELLKIEKKEPVS